MYLRSSKATPRPKLGRQSVEEAEGAAAGRAWRDGWASPGRGSGGDLAQGRQWSGNAQERVWGMVARAVGHLVKETRQAG